MKEFDNRYTPDDGAHRDWFALEVHPKMAEAVCESLSEKEFDCLHPTYGVARRYGRRGERRLPLFPGYVFARFDPHHRWPVVITPGVKAVVSFNKEPAAIPPEQIESIRVALRCGFPLGPHPAPVLGQRVTINHGVLKGIEGVLVDVKKGWRVIISVPLIHQSLSVEIDYDNLRPSAVAERPLIDTRVRQHA